MTWGFVLDGLPVEDGDDWGGGDRPEGSDDDDDDEDQEEEDQAEDRPYARPITPALAIPRSTCLLRGLRPRTRAEALLPLDGTGTRGAAAGHDAPSCAGRSIFSAGPSRASWSSLFTWPNAGRRGRLRLARLMKAGGGPDLWQRPMKLEHGRGNPASS